MHTEPKAARSDAKPDAGPAPAPDAAASGTTLSAPPPPPPVRTDIVNSVPSTPIAVPPVANPQTPHLVAPSSVTTKPEAVAPDDAPLAPPPSREIVQSARIVDRLGQAEMHLGVRTESFGSVQVHTVVRNSQVGLTVGSERGDIKAFFAGEVPGLESNLRQYELNFADIRFLGGPASGLNAQTGGNAHSQSFQPGRSFVPAVTQPAHAAEQEPEEYRQDSRAGLSVHA
jgi:hypothetical protein